MAEALDTLRTRKKAATRQSLHEAALRLAVERGLDGVTVEDIADDAGVSRRTFSNYFANKEDAILHADRERTAELVALVEGRPAGEPPWQALRAATGVLYRAQATPDPEWVTQLRLLRRHPSLLARQAGDHITLEQDLAAVLIRRGHDLDRETAQLMASTFLTVVRTASVLWLEEPGKQPLPDVVDRLLGRLRFEG
ncbi:TetR/AcrR family transcriptional regulator [Labedaea rhizosphaerae]|uniref:TetR family transcriptional regulator n=1 Tax=Labedaea rhizosphaerae TaxID=598644 RepID=A0A4R6SGA5_LABRH|nr:TetR/AcrR family transcriptional regulator [Labedaea rhizosphaerae]TDQ00704.1 TetR family transcriptional regulator [Labedaea rhizosphaerae]